MPISTQSEPNEAAVADSAEKITVLLVDDDPAFGELQRYLLSHAGISVGIAQGVQEGLHRLSEETFDAIILDYRLPDGSAWTVVDAAATRVPEVPVILVTAAGSEELASESTRRGVSEYAIKGERFWSQLPETVERVVAGSRAKQRLRETRALFNLIDKHTEDVISVSSPSGAIRYMSSSSLKVFGYDPRELVGFGYSEIIHPDDKSIVERFVATVASQGHGLAQFRYRRKDGTIGWIESNASLFGSHGSDVQNEVVTVSREISGRKAIEENLQAREKQLQESEDRYRRLVDSIEDYAILMLDAQGNVSSWTTAAQRIKGYEAGEIVGKHFSCFYTDEDKKRGHPADVLETAEREGRLTEEGLRVRKNGERFWAAVSITAIRDKNGNLRGFSKVTRDITERRESEDKIRQDEEMFRALLESAPDAVIIADRQGKIALVNAQAERLFRYGRHEMEGQLVELLIPSGSRSRHAEHRRTYGATARVRQMGTGMELKGLRKTGEEFPVEVSLSPIQTSQGSWVAAAIRDITDRKEVEEQLVIARHRAEEASLAKSEFLAAVSHEIRTPMNAILGMSELLSRTELDDEQRKYVSVFSRAGSNLLVLINDILDLSKIEAGQLELDNGEFDIRDLIDQTIELIAPKAQAKRIAMRAHVLPSVAALLVGDPARLRQVLINLLGNAVKFTDSGDIGLTVQACQSGIEFVVADTGIGIPESQLGTIFEAFRQGDASITRKYGGTGLGLGISRRLVERMGGQLSVASKVGEGSTFRFAVPLPSVSRVLEPSAPIQDFHGRRIALIDSDATNRLIMRETLMAWGLEVDEFSTPHEALSVLWQKAAAGDVYSAAIVDRNPPMMDGFEQVKRIKEPAPSIPVILLSSEERPGDAALRKGADIAGYAIRPVGRTNLLQLVANALKKPSPSSVPVAENLSGPIDDLKLQQSLRILVAEDSTDNQLLIQLYLEDGSHRLTFCANGQEALDVSAATQFDIVLMDIQMPVMDGFTATRRIREREEQQQVPAVPIIALSANARPQDISMSLEAGCTAYLSKPISRRRLLSALEQYAVAPSNGDDESFAISSRIAALVPSYLESRLGDTGRMVEMLSNNDFSGIRALAHNLKGNGASYGFSDLSKLGAAMQAAAEAGDSDTLGRQIDELRRFLEGASQKLSL